MAKVLKQSTSSADFLLEDIKSEDLPSSGSERVDIDSIDSPFMASIGQTIAVDTSAAAVTVVMPTMEASDQPIVIYDKASTFETNNCTLDRNGQTFLDETGASTASDFVLDINNYKVTVFGGADLIVR